MKNLEKTHILVTGGAGFIGSHLTEKLLSLGCRVTVLDNFSTGRRENLAPFADDPRFTLIEGDIRDTACCEAAVSGVDHVLHEAALGSVPRSIKDPLTTWAVNAGGFANMLTAAKDAGVKRFIYASSSSVYGDDPSATKSEERLGDQLSPYAISKRANELLAENFKRVYGLNTVGLRYFNVFGPRQQPGGAYAAVIPKFITALLAGTPPVIYGDGSNSRDFTYIANVVSANLLALTADVPERAGVFYNVGCGASTSLNELFAVIRATLSRSIAPEIGNIEAEYAPPRQGDIAMSLAEIGRISSELGYSPLTGLAEGLRRSCEYYAGQK